MATENIQELLQLGIQAARQGNRAAARRLLMQVVEQDPNNELAWIWLASVAETVVQRRDYLERVLQINPNNDRARQALNRLKRTAPDTPPPSSATPARRERAATPDLNALRPQVRRQRRLRLSRQSRITLALLGLVLLGTGILLLWLEMSGESSTEATYTPLGEEEVAIEPTQTSALLFISPTPVETQVRTMRPPQSPQATWTPSPTLTPTALPTATATPPPLNNYNILITRQTSGEASSGLYTIQADGTREQRLNFTVSSADQSAGLNLLSIFDAVYSPDGNWIAFSARIQPTGENASTTPHDLFIAPAEGGEVRRLTTLEADHVEAVSWAPNGDRVAFASDADGDFDVYIVSFNGGSPRKITFNNFVDRDPAWSPVDEDVIVYATERAGPGEIEIYSMNPRGRDHKRLTNNANDSYAPDWSPDGEQIVFVSSRRGNNDLYIMNAQGLGQRAILVRDVDADEFEPAWSPNGNWIAFSSNREGTALALFLIQSNGTNLQQLSIGDATSNILYPDWKP